MEELLGIGQVIAHEWTRIGGEESLSLVMILQKMVLTLVLGLFVCGIYRKTYRGVVYSQSFNNALVILALITTLVIIAITSNIILSLGMVGALSIVRFRNAVKDPLDVTFMFWSLAIGIAVGAGFFALAMFGSAFIGGVLYALSLYKVTQMPYLLVLHYANNCDSQVFALLDQYDRYKVKTKSIQGDVTELISELRLKKDQSQTVLNALAAISGVTHSVLIDHEQTV